MTGAYGLAVWLTRDRGELRSLANRLKQTAQFSGRKLMKSAGLTRQTLDNWSSGRAVPEPENLAKVAKALALYVQRLRSLESDLAQLAREEEQRRAAKRETPPADDLPLFPTGTG